MPLQESIDLLTSSCRSDLQLQTVCECISLFLPRLAIISIPSSFTRKELKTATQSQFRADGYGCHLSTISHSSVGGATDSQWRFLSIYHLSLRWVPPTPRPSVVPPTFIFNMIDDKIGGGFGTVENIARLFDASLGFGGSAFIH